MKATKMMFTVIFSLFFFSLNSLAQVRLMENVPKVQYLLPGEYWLCSAQVESHVPLLMVDLDYYYNVTDWSWVQNYNCGTQRSDSLYSWASSGSQPWQVMFLSNYEDTAPTSLSMMWTNGIYNIPIGEAMSVDFVVDALDVNLDSWSSSESITLQGIDGVVGEVNGDGVIDQMDVYVLRDYFNNNPSPDNYDGRYTATGLNYGRGAILHPWASKSSIALLNLYIHNPNSPIIAGLGIGGLYSEKPIIVNNAYSEEYENGLLKISAGANSYISVATAEGKIIEAFSETGILEIETREGYKVSVATVGDGNEITDVDVTENIPTEFSLSQNYPNPFNPSTTIQFSLAGDSQVSLKIYDILGREVADLINENLSSGQHAINFDGSKLASGTYFCRLTAGANVSVKKMTLLK